MQIVQIRYLMTAGVAAIFLLAILFVNFIEPKDLAPEFLLFLQSRISQIIVVMVFILCLFILWLMISSKITSLYVALFELIAVFLVIATTIPLFSVAYRLFGLENSEGILVIPSAKDAVLFSALAFMGSGHPKLIPSDAIMVLYSIEVTLGYFFIPIIVAIGFILIDRYET